MSHPEPHWKHQDEPSLADRIVTALILVLLVVEVVGIHKGWFA